MQTKTNLKAGALPINPNKSLVRGRATGLQINTRPKADTLSLNHEHTL